jgi:GT2 family glycosyltransferase
MKDEMLTALIVNYNTSSFIEVSLYALKKLTKNRYRVIICDNGSIDSDKEKIKKIVNEHSNVELFFRQQTGPAGIGHGEALNILIKKINTKYGVLLDADTFFLKKDWDEILINQLNDKIKIIGCPPVSSSSKVNDIKKPVDFPSVYATLFDNRIFKSLRIDMRPKNYEIGQDTGWEMRK